MTKPILYLDHDVHLYFVEALRRRGYEAHSTQECGNRQLTDDAQLTFATDKNWTLLSYNVGDFNALHQRLMSEGRGHAGIILSAQGNPSRTLRRLLNLLFLSSPNDFFQSHAFPWFMVGCVKPLGGADSA